MPRALLEKNLPFSPFPLFIIIEYEEKAMRK